MTQTPTPRREPRTAACPMCGRRPNQHLREFMASPREPVDKDSFVAGSRAVWERLGDARTELLSDLEEAVGGLRLEDNFDGHVLNGFARCRAAVIQLFRDKQSEEER